MVHGMSSSVIHYVQEVLDKIARALGKQACHEYLLCVHSMVL
jgi:hypothetical protein